MFALLFGGAFPSVALAQGFISPSFGYNFGGDAGCLSATDCEDKNWNFGVSFGALGPVVGFEAELTYEDEFLGETPINASKVMTLMANFMLAPRITIVQPYGLVGIGMIRTAVEDIIGGSDESENQIGWTIGGGVIVFLSRNVGLKGDVRYYHSFEALDLFGIELARDENRLDFGRAAFGVVFAF
jgi:opacity protein-like surface antigen